MATKFGQFSNTTAGACLMELCSGIANATGIDVAAIILFNIGYELEGGCTSMVVKDDNGLVYHVRQPPLVTIALDSSHTTPLYRLATLTLVCFWAGTSRTGHGSWLSACALCSSTLV
jgi:hypothetical protein